MWIWHGIWADILKTSYTSGFTSLYRIRLASSQLGAHQRSQSLSAPVSAGRPYSESGVTDGAEGEVMQSRWCNQSALLVAFLYIPGLCCNVRSVTKGRARGTSKVDCSIVDKKKQWYPNSKQPMLCLHSGKDSSSPTLSHLEAKGNLQRQSKSGTSVKPPSLGFKWPKKLCVECKRHPTVFHIHNGIRWISTWKCPFLSLPFRRVEHYMSRCRPLFL